ncbi:MAG: hypothetical protein ABW328_16570 [Ilumatobacteraceae bacterium]
MARPDGPPPFAATIVIAGVAAVAFLLAVTVPLLTTALALMAFGVVHNVAELRYVGGRFSGLLRGGYLVVLGGIITGIVVSRLVGVLFGGSWSLTTEIVLSYGLLVAAVVGGLGRRSAPGTSAALGVLAVLLVVSLTHPDQHVVVVTHLHNVVPLVFLWELSGAMRGRHRRAFRGVQLAWVVVVPALLLAGVADGPLQHATTSIGLGGASGLAPSTAPASTVGTTLGMRFLAVFAFLQLMHFVVWVAVIPRWSAASTATFEQRVPALGGRRPWVIAGAAGLALAVLFVVDYAQGRTVYAALASYHAYLELPIVLAVVVGWRARWAR